MAYLEKNDIVAAFRAGGIERGALLMLHADAIVLAQTAPMPTEDRYALLFDALDEVLGAEGTLVVPTFTYSATQGQDFVVEDTPSSVGALTEYFRHLPGVMRSRDPIFSVAARGALADKIAGAACNDAFGADSVFGLLDRHSALIACLACGFDRITYTHFVEQAVGVSYRYFKDFPYTTRSGAVSETGMTKYFVRDLDRKSEIDLSGLEKRLVESGHLTKVGVGRLGLATVSCSAFRAAATAMIAEQENALIVEGRQ